ncbi:hypothetical protein ACJ2A9_16180 [Anaerobacillus sp. MEB173]|uniref:endolytic transglycosylase MltG n=1 Tax=Anaerobacillus sp. MEB173 TaxID=3383345 RepID=UPI003F935E79
MDKHTARGLAMGLIITAIALILFKPVFANEPVNTKVHEEMITQESIQSFLEENNFIVVHKEEYETLISGQSDNNSQDEASNQKTEETSTVETPKQQSTAEQQKAEEKKEEENQVVTHQITIEKGMVSRDVAILLKHSGLVRTETEFIKRLEAKDAAKYVQIGTYKLDTSMSIDQIISVITRNRA